MECSDAASVVACYNVMVLFVIARENISALLACFAFHFILQLPIYTDNVARVEVFKI